MLASNPMIFKRLVLELTSRCNLLQVTGLAGRKVGNDLHTTFDMTFDREAAEIATVIALMFVSSGLVHAADRNSLNSRSWVGTVLVGLGSNLP